MSPVVRVLTVVMTVLFLLAVAVQYNDPDPLRWTAVYGAAATACILALRRRLPRWLPAIVAAVAVAWAGTMVPAAIGHVAPGDLFREIGMDSPDIEVAREAVGLVLVALWMVVLLLTAPRGRDRAG